MEDLIMGFTDKFAEYAGTLLVYSTVLVPFVIETVYTKIKKPETEFFRSLWSWVIAIILIFPVWQLQVLIGVGWMHETISIIEVLIWGLTAALAANLSWTNVAWLKVIAINIIEMLPGKK